MKFDCVIDQVITEMERSVISPEQIQNEVQENEISGVSVHMMWLWKTCHRNSSVVCVPVPTEEIARRLNDDSKRRNDKWYDSIPDDPRELIGKEFLYSGTKKYVGCIRKRSVKSTKGNVYYDCWFDDNSTCVLSRKDARGMLTKKQWLVPIPYEKQSTRKKKINYYDNDECTESDEFDEIEELNAVCDPYMWIPETETDESD